jgi:hypothetical protein
MNRLLRSGRGGFWRRKSTPGGDWLEVAVNQSALRQEGKPVIAVIRIDPDGGGAMLEDSIAPRERHWSHVGAKRCLCPWPQLHLTVVS